MRESSTYGSVRRALSNGCPYRVSGRRPRVAPDGPINHAGECPNPSPLLEAGPSSHRRGGSYRIPVRHTGSVIYFTFDALKIMVSSQADCGRLPSLGRQGIGRVSPCRTRSSSPWSSKGGPIELGLRDSG